MIHSDSRPSGYRITPNEAWPGDLVVLGGWENLVSQPSALSPVIAYFGSDDPVIALVLAAVPEVFGPHTPHGVRPPNFTVSLEGDPLERHRRMLYVVCLGMPSTTLGWIEEDGASRVRIDPSEVDP